MDTPIIKEAKQKAQPKCQPTKTAHTDGYQARSGKQWVAQTTGNNKNKKQKWKWKTKMKMKLKNKNEKQIWKALTQRSKHVWTRF